MLQCRRRYKKRNLTFFTFWNIWVIFFPNMISLLKDLGYRNLRTLSQIEDSIHSRKLFKSFGEDPQYDKELREEKPKALIGSKYWKTPGLFKVQPEKKATIASIKTLCLDLLVKILLVVLVPIANSNSKCNSATRKFIMSFSIYSIFQFKQRSSSCWPCICWYWG